MCTWWQRIRVSVEHTVTIQIVYPHIIRRVVSVIRIRTLAIIRICFAAEVTPSAVIVRVTARALPYRAQRNQRDRC